MKLASEFVQHTIETMTVHMLCLVFNILENYIYQKLWNDYTRVSLSILRDSVVLIQIRSTIIPNSRKRKHWKSSMQVNMTYQRTREHKFFNRVRNFIALSQIQTFNFTETIKKTCLQINTTYQRTRECKNLPSERKITQKISSIIKKMKYSINVKN